jgi:hypothetical protein
MTRITQEKHRGSRGLQWLDGKESVAFVRCRICGDYRRVISGRHLSKHGADRETYMDEYRLSPDELIAKEFRKRQSSRRGYHPHGKSDWIAAIKKIYKRDGQIFAGYLQDKYSHLYNQGTWLFGDWDNALCEAGFQPEKVRMTRFWDQERVVREIHGLRKRNLLLYAKYVLKQHPRLFSAALRHAGLGILRCLWLV